MGDNRYEGSFLSAGGCSYQAHSLHWLGIEEILRQLRACKNELAYSITTLQQIAHEQECTEQHYERLARAVTCLIEVVRKPVAGSVLTESWIMERDQAVMALRGILEGAIPQDESIVVDPTPFQTQFQEAMHALIGSPEYLPSLRYFRAAYDYRKHFPWLAESTKASIMQQTGLSYALQAALVTYVVPDDSEALSTEIQSATGEDLDESICLDALWVGELIVATAATVRERFNLERFEKHLARAQGEMHVETLKQHIAAAFIAYYKRCEVGTVPDPWDLML